MDLYIAVAVVGRAWFPYSRALCNKYPCDWQQVLHNAGGFHL